MEKQILLEELQKFGLNPTEWKIMGRKQSSLSRTMYLKNRQDHQFQLKGFIKRVTLKPQWEKIELLSI